MSGLVEITAPALEPVTLAEAKLHLRVDTSADDALITTLILAARTLAEEVSGRAFIDQTWDWFLDEFENSDTLLRIPKPPLNSIVTLKYIDEDGATITLAASEYKVDTASEPGRVVPAFDKTWPATRDEINAVEIRFLAGFGTATADVPDRFKAAIKLIVGGWYEFREDIIATGAVPQTLPVPLASLSLLRQTSVLRL